MRAISITSLQDLGQRHAVLQFRSGLLPGLLALLLMNPVMALSDPTAPAPGWAATTMTPETKTQTHELSASLQQIMKIGNARLAVINGQSYRIGDDKQGIKILDIRQKEVVIRQNSQEIVLTMNHPTLAVQAVVHQQKKIKTQSKNNPDSHRTKIHKHRQGAQP